MKITTTEVFTCDHCGKKQFRKCDMSRHEKWCKKNPANKHKCFEHCKHLTKTREECKSLTDSDFSSSRVVFTCEVLQKQMYSFIAERRKLPIINEGKAERMPLQCDKYEDKNPFFDGGETSDLNFDELEFF